MNANGHIDALMAPRNVVLIGASDKNWSVRIWDNLVRFGFEGRVYPVNPNRSEIWGTRCYASLAELPEAPDHLALLVPHEDTLTTLEAGGKLGARSASLFAAGFGEGGDAAGRERGQRLRRILTAYDIAAVGPNCMGLAVGRSRFCTFPDEQIEPLGRGSVAALTQSGTLAQTFARGLVDAGLTLAYLISCGNQAGLSFADYIDHLADDPDLRVIACYVESVVDSRRFLAAAEKARRNDKHLIVVKAGDSETGRRAAFAHTGSLAGSRDVFDVFARDVGIVRVDALEDMIEAAAFLSRMQRPRGKSVCVVTNSGALKSLAMDAAENCGLDLAQLAPVTAKKLREILPESDGSNPFDTKRTLRTNEYMACIEVLHDDPSVDLILVAEELPRQAGIERKVRNLTALDTWVKESATKPVALFSPVSLRETSYMQELQDTLSSVPILRDIGKTFRAIAKIAAPPGAPVEPRSQTACANPALIEFWRERARGLTAPAVLNEVQSKELLTAYGIVAPPEEKVASAEAAVAAAARIGFPVVLKAVSAAIPHKSDAGLVHLGLRDAAAVRAAALAVSQRCADLSAPLDGLLVTRHISGGVEMVLGIHRDQEMGLVAMVGMGGVWLELFKDVAFAPPGLDEKRAREAIAATRAAKILAGYRGAPICDIDALARAMVAIGALALDLGDIIESIDVNPLLVMPEGEGALALDGLVVLRPGQMSQ